MMLYESVASDTCELCLALASNASFSAPIDLSSPTTGSFFISANVRMFRLSCTPGLRHSQQQAMARPKGEVLLFCKSPHWPKLRCLVEHHSSSWALGAEDLPGGTCIGGTPWATCRGQGRLKRDLGGIQAIMDTSPLPTRSASSTNIFSLSCSSYQALSSTVSPLALDH